MEGQLHALSAPPAAQASAYEVRCVAGWPGRHTDAGNLHRPMRHKLPDVNAMRYDLTADFSTRVQHGYAITAGRLQGSYAAKTRDQPAS